MGQAEENEIIFHDSETLKNGPYFSYIPGRGELLEWKTALV